jgi:hypothetical protein
MQNDRRQFLANTGVICATALAAPLMGLSQAQAADIPGSFEIPELQLLSQDVYAARVKEWFYLHSEDVTEQGNLQLIKVRDSGSSPRIERFALTFRSRRGADPLLRGYYKVAGESFDLFVKHVFERKDRQYYVADFALLR